MTHDKGDFAMLSVDVCLPSGSSCSIELLPGSRVCDLKVEAQRQLRRGFLKLAFRGRQLDLSSTLSDLGVRSGDSIDALVQPVKIACTRKAFAAYVPGGSVVTWGDPAWGADSSMVREQLVRVQKIRANGHAFAAILDDGSVVTWGNPVNGGDCSPVREQLVQVREIRAADTAFAAILDDCSVVTWGHAGNGGDCSQVREQLVHVQQIQGNRQAFAALLYDRSAVTWGHVVYGGDSRQVRLVGVRQIQAADRSFAAILDDGSVVTWGYRYAGGDSSSVQSQLMQVQQIQATKDSVAQKTQNQPFVLLVSWFGSCLVMSPKGKPILFVSFGQLRGRFRCYPR